MFFAYFGPETTLPLASVLAASLGFIMMMGRRSLRVATKIVQLAGSRFGKTSRGGSDTSSPQLTPGMRSDRPHRGGEVPSWVRPNRSANPTSAAADRSQEGGEPSNV